MRGRLVLVALVDLFLWLLVAWLVTAPPDVPLRRRAYFHTALACRAVAVRFGQWAIDAETNYWREVAKS